MTEGERLARAHRAQSAYDEFLAPMFNELDSEYSARILEVANTELLFWRRASKLTRLSDALRTVRTLRNGMQAMIADGEVARSEHERSKRIEKMSDAQRRLLKIGSGY